MGLQRLFDAAAGALAAALALGVGELVAGLTGANSLIVGVGNFIVDHTPGPVVNATIDALGSNDKPFLLASIVFVVLLVGALVGAVARQRRRVALVAFAAFGLAGAFAGARDPLSPGVVPFIVAGVATATGWWAFGRLVDAATVRLITSSAKPTPWRHRPSDGTAMPPPTEVPRPGLADRRRFLSFAGAAAGGTALSAFLGRSVLGSGVDVEAQRAAITLPPSRLGSEPNAVDLTIEGQTPFITSNDDFYRIDTALFQPRVDVGDWRLQVKGMVDRPFELSFDELLEMASLEEVVTLNCVSNQVGGDLVGNAVWLGVPLPALLERAGVQPNATQIVGRSVDGFSAGFPTEVALDGRAAMVAIGMNGEPLPGRHGFPARLVVPGLYGYVSATKWLREIELTRLDLFDGYWIPRGWSKLAPIKTQSRIDVPRAGRSTVAGAQPIAGVAWGGVRSIDRVEVRATLEDEDAGEWQEARLGERLNESTWRQWVLEWDATPGTYQIEVRATDGNGDTQTPERHEPAPNGATGYHRIRVRVRDG